MDATADICALKVYKSPHPPKKFQQKFENEIQNMMRVSHRHIASFYAAYIHERKNGDSPEFGILMQPAATSGTLEQLISISRVSTTEKLSKETRDALTQAMGCLSSALEFVHQHMIRHKDLKPKNVLIHEGKALLTDYGSSWDGWGTATLATASPADYRMHTLRYAAPEVASRDPRSAKSDVFSLGCVFYEMFCALESGARWYDGEYWNIKVNTPLRNSLSQWRSAFPEIIPVMHRMLDPQSENRPSAHLIVATLSAAHFCDNCCQDHGKASVPNPISSAGKEVEQMMNRLKFQEPTESPIAGPSMIRRSSASLTFPKVSSWRTLASSTRRDTRIQEEDSDEDSA